jgi:hypothetical protein
VAPFALFFGASCNALLGNQPGYLVDAATGDAVSDGAGGWTGCGDDLSNIGGGDFRIAFTLQTTMQGAVALLNQRAVCDHGGLWDIHLSFFNPGGIDLETDDGRHYSLLSNVTVVNDGLSHQIVVTRLAGALGIAVDGDSSGVIDRRLASSPAIFAELSPLRRGLDVCLVNGIQTLMGRIDDICIVHR